MGTASFNGIPVSRAEAKLLGLTVTDETTAEKRQRRHDAKMVSGSIIARAVASGLVVETTLTEMNVDLLAYHRKWENRTFVAEEGDVKNSLVFQSSKLTNGTIQAIFHSDATKSASDVRDELRATRREWKGKKPPKMKTVRLILAGWRNGTDYVDITNTMRGRIIGKSSHGVQVFNVPNFAIVATLARFVSDPIDVNIILTAIDVKLPTPTPTAKPKVKELQTV